MPTGLSYLVNTCDVHTTTVVLNVLLLTRFTVTVLIRAMSIRSYFKPRDGLPDPEGSFSTCLPTQVVALVNKAAEKAIVNKGVVRSAVSTLRLIFVVASDAASFFVLFHAARRLKLLELRCRMHV